MSDTMWNRLLASRAVALEEWASTRDPMPVSVFLDAALAAALIAEGWTPPRHSAERDDA